MSGPTPQPPPDDVRATPADTDEHSPTGAGAAADDVEAFLALVGAPQTSAMRAATTLVLGGAMVLLLISDRDNAPEPPDQHEPAGALGAILLVHDSPRPGSCSRGRAVWDASHAEHVVGMLLPVVARHVVPLMFATGRAAGGTVNRYRGRRDRARDVAAAPEQELAAAHEQERVDR